MSLFKRLFVREIQQEAHEVKTFTFEGADAESLSYKAGQYLTLVLPGERGDIRRSYSITSAPLLQEPLSIGVKRIENGLFSRYLSDTVRVGDEILTSGAGGIFTLPEDLGPYAQLFFFAAGSGITPVYSLLKTVLHAHPELQVVLIYSNHSPRHAIFLKELQQLAEKFPRQFTLELLYSNSKNLLRARLYKDLVKALVREHARTDPGHMLAYLCGPENYMRKCVYGLRQLSVPAENIRREHFSTQKIGPPLTPPDTRAHAVTLRLRGSDHEITAQYPDTILEAAKKKGIALPYSCEVGRCGNCVARCSSGEVWMSYNEVLTERDLSSGLVLTCVGYPIGGDVQLEIP